jgi:CHAT domain-containing protein
MVKAAKMAKKSAAVLFVTLISLFTVLPVAHPEETGPYTGIQPLLDDKTAVLVYHTGNGTVDVVRPGSVVTRELGNTAEPLEVKLGFFADILGSLNAMAPYQDEAFGLWTILIKPAVGDLAGIERLGIIPGSTLSGLPFGALVSRKDPKRPRFLIDDYALFYAPSVDLMARALTTDKSALTGGIVIGNAKYPAGYGTLRMAQPEMQDVAFFVPGAVLYEGDAAGEAVLKNKLSEGPISVLHITTHSSIKPGSDDNSRLLLTAGGGDDGNLTVAEVAAMTMDVDLVTISADRAGITWGTSGGFPGAFLTAGAASVIAPLCMIDKGMTAILMNFFYTYLPDNDKAQALRLAQKNIIDFEKDKGRFRFAHPAFWAPFVLYGSFK